MFVSDIKEDYDSYGLPYEFADCLPEFCPTCGAPMEIGETLTGLHCSNIRCHDKLIMRIKALCVNLGILNFGESTIEKFIDYYDVTSPLEVFMLRPGVPISDEVSEKVSESIASQIAEKNHFMLWEYVRVANIPNVQTSAREIFKGFSTIDEAYEAINNGGVGFIQERLGIDKGGEVSIRAMKIYQSLVEYKDELINCVKYVDIINIENKRELNVVCSDQVGEPFKKKAEFYSYINNTYGDRVHVNFLPSVNSKIDYLVWAGADGSPARYTSKVSKVERYNEKGAGIPILTAAQFIKDLEGGRYV